MINSKFVIDIVDTLDVMESFAIVMPLMHTNLKLLNDDEHLNIEQKRHILFAVASGLASVHARGISHNDIKLENILLDRFYVPRVADFGLADIGRGAGTKAYKAPEHFNKSCKFDAIKADAWSFGILCFRLLENRHPLNDEIFEEFVCG